MEWINFVIGSACGFVAVAIVLFAIRIIRNRRQPGYAELLYNLRRDLLAETMRRRIQLERKQTRAVMQATKLLSASRGIPPGKSFDTYRDAFGKALFVFQKELASSRPFLNQETATVCEEIESILVDMVTLSAEESRKMAADLWASLTSARLRYDDCVQAETDHEALKTDTVRLITMNGRKNGHRMPAQADSK